MIILKPEKYVSEYGSEYLKIQGSYYMGEKRKVCDWLGLVGGL